MAGPNGTGAALPPAAPRARRGTREMILDAAEAAVLDKGFGATSIEELIAAVGITKSGFFYHFRDKSAMAQAMLARHLEREEALFDGIFERAAELHEDPLHAFLIGLKMLAETLADLPNGHPGCLIAAICYQENLFDREVHALNRTVVLRWRQRFRGHLARIAERHPQRLDLELDDLADMLCAVADGGIILGKVLREPQALPRQILLYRSVVRATFEG